MLDVFVPVDADPAVVARLKALDARVTVCPREPGVPGDPTYHRLRAALAEGALPFTCQGNENGIAVEGGFTLGYEMAAALAGGPALDRLVVQVGGGALASACIESIDDCVALGALPQAPRFHAVQTEGAWPLRRAFDRVAARLPADATPEDVREALSYAATHRSAFMWPWEEEPHSVAHGILDDETYDWLAVVEGMLRTGGSPVVVGEDLPGPCQRARRQRHGHRRRPDGLLRARRAARPAGPRGDRRPRTGRRPLHRRPPIATARAGCGGTRRPDVVRAA